MVRRWGPAGLLLGIGVVLVLALAWSAPVVAGIEGVLVLVLALVFSPWCFPRPVSLADARRLSAADGMPIVLWRPGCQYCLRLRLYLLGTGARRLHWVDIWSDPDAAAALRGYADGNETPLSWFATARTSIRLRPGSGNSRGHRP